MSSHTRLLLAAAALVALTLLVYWPAMGGGFVWDDDSFVHENEWIRSSDGLYHFWALWLPPDERPPDYFPLASTTLWLEWRLWGLDEPGRDVTDADAVPFHVTNVLLHILASLLLWRLLVRLRLPVPHPGGVAWLAALIFAVHPVNVESVAWITQRKNTVAMVFALLSALALVRHEEKGGRVAYAASLVAFVLALLGKSAVVTLPLVFLVLAWWRRGTVTLRDVGRATPFLFMGALFAGVTVFYQYASVAGREVIRSDGWLSRVLGMGAAVWFYLSKALFPVKPTFVYPRWSVDSLNPAWYLPLTALVGLAWVLWRLREKTGRHVLAALGCYVLMLLPVLGLLDIYFMRYSLVADHWQYFALPAVVVCVAGGADRLGARGRPWLPAGVGVAVVLAFAVGSWRYASAYVSESALWEDTLAKNPRCWLAHNNLGVAERQRGRTDAAITHFRAAVELEPEYSEAHSNLGLLLEAGGRRAEARTHYDRALRADPRDPVAHYNLAGLLAAEGQGAEAMGHYRRALELDSAYAAAHVNLANLLLRAGAGDRAMVHYRRALGIDPELPEARYNLAVILWTLGERDAAGREYSALLDTDASLAGKLRAWMDANVP